MASISPVPKSRGSAPISAHPAFPLVVALWFAALLGLGSLILPAALIERLVTATGLADLITAAAPPLGFKARAAIALGGTVLGAVLGLLAARKLARPAADTPRRRSIKGEDTPRRTPLSPRDELGSDSFDSVAGFATARRRALAGDEDAGPSDFLVAAPLPGHRHEPGFAFSQPACDPEPLDLEELAEFTEVEEFESDTGSPEEETAMSEAQVFSPSPAANADNEPLNFSPPSMARFATSEPVDEPEAEQFTDIEEEFPEEEPEAQQHSIVPEPAQMDQIADQQPASEPVSGEQDTDEPGLVQLVQRLAATLERRREWSAAQAGRQAEAPRFPRAVIDTDFGTDFGADFGADFDIAAPAEAAQAMAAFFSAPDAAEDAEMPADDEFAPEGQEFVPVAEPAPATIRQLRPFAGLERIEDADDEDADGEDDLEHLAASLSLPLGRAAEPDAGSEFAAEDEPEAVTEEAVAEEAEADEAYSSLLVMKNPFRDHRPEFVRVEEPEAETVQPAVVFPHEVPNAARIFDRPAGQTVAPVEAAMEIPVPARAPVSNEDNDRVLREALMNLQRIGKN